MKKSRHINNWSDKKENILKFWREECQIYNYLYNQNVEYYQSLDKWLGIVAIMLSAITGTTLVNQGNNSSPESASRNHIILLIFGMISMVNTFIQSLRQFLDIPNKLNSNHNAAKQNSCIAMDIDEQLILSKCDRMDGKEFMKNIKLRKNELVKNGPLILKRQWHKFRKRIENGEPISFLSKSFMNNYLKQTVNISGAMDIKLLESASNHSSDSNSLSSLDKDNRATNQNNNLHSNNKKANIVTKRKSRIVPSYRESSYGNSNTTKHVRLKSQTEKPILNLVNNNSNNTSHNIVYGSRNTSNSSADSNGSNLHDVYTDINLLESNIDTTISSNISSIDLTNNYDVDNINNTTAQNPNHKNNRDDIYIQMEENIESIDSTNFSNHNTVNHNTNNDNTYSIVNNYATTSNENTDTDSDNNHLHSDDEYTNSEEEFLKSINDDNKCQRQLSQFISNTSPYKKTKKYIRNEHTYL
jgi:hypothetical protein